MRLLNTPHRQLEEFTPLSEDRVTLYTCGPTVYNRLHIGNWVAYIRWDTLVRTLLLNGYTVERVMNITDVGHLTGENEGDADSGEDKMQKGARREGVTAWDVAKRYSEDFLLGMQKLNLLAPEHLTKATDFIPEQIALVKLLEERGYTYRISDGIYFDTSLYEQYATFANLDLEGIQAGARVEFNQEKKNPTDFALWKFSPADEQRDMEWDSPWGKGFPGWHIECSAMAMAKLGNTIDIHTGGIDHIPVHHTNEIAQSEAATGEKFVNYWLHNNHLTVDGVKISKSLGNGYTLDDLAERGFSPQDYRMFVLQSHYRTQTNFSWDNLQAACQRLKHWRGVAELRWQSIDDVIVDDNNAHSRVEEAIATARQALKNALNDDLNTPLALSAVEEAFSTIEGSVLMTEDLHSFNIFLSEIDKTLGLAVIEATPDITDEQRSLINDRQRARQQKDWETSDRLRDELLSEGLAIKDSAHGAIWHRS